MTPRLAFSALEISGTIATLLLLTPFAVLAIVVRRALTSEAQETEAVVPAPLAPPSNAAGELKREDDGSSLEARILAAEARGDEAELAGLILAAARTAASRDHISEATLLLRKSIACAARAGDAFVHAEARLELAEIARASGDLTSACEHWQMARQLFHELADKVRVANTDAIMRHHGCPTDWVLNDF